MKVVGVSSSPRRGGNTDILLDMVLEGARSRGAVTEKIFLNALQPKVAILREEGSNGDREMTSAFYQAGFEVWDITMTDLIEGRAGLNDFRGIAFVGGFSYADVLDSAKGWAGAIRFHEKLYDQFNTFYKRPDTFSLGVWNGCQLIALLGWVPWKGIADAVQPRFIQNKSGRFESRFSAVRILPGPSIKRLLTSRGQPWCLLARQQVQLESSP